ncbi:MAG: hypothetical protein IPG08_12455 [Sphingobacteriaceae bacterium]|nr:hypothetical protein [Sphingobacteriaceae bacterium]
MRQQVFDPGDYQGFMFLQKRNFVNSKYHLVKANQASSNYSSRIPNQNNWTNAAPCVNEGFELGNLTGGNATIGSNNSTSLACKYGPLPTSTVLGAPNFVIQTTPFFDPIVGAIPNSPFPGNKVVKLNDGNFANPNFNVVRLTQGFPVTASNFLYEFAYIAVMNGVHGCCEQPYMYVRVRDCIGILQTCPVFSITPPSAGCPGTGPTTWSANTNSPPDKFNTSWQKYSIDLTAFINSCVSIEVTVGDCTFWTLWLCIF